MEMSSKQQGWRLPVALVSGLCLAGLSACGGGGGGGTPAPSTSSPSNPAPVSPDTSTTGQAPRITQAPAAIGAPAGASSTFSVQAAGAGPLSYQWTLNQAPIDGATGATYTRSAMRAADNGAVLRVNVSGPAGSTESGAIALAIDGIGLRPFAGAIGDKPNPGMFKNPHDFTSLAIATDATLYGVIGKKVWKVTPDRVWTELGKDVCLGEAKVALDKNRNVFIGCRYSVLKVTPAGVLSTYAGSNMEHGTVDGPAATARFRTISALAVDAGGVVYVGDPQNGAVRRIGTDGVVSTLPVAPARFSGVRSLALDAAGNLFVGEKTAIRKVTPAGVVSTLAGDLLAAGVADGNGDAARFDSPSGIVVDADGTLFVADTGNRAIRKVTPSGQVSTIAGRRDQPGSADGFGKMAWFASPTAIAIDAAGLLYVADTPNGIVRKVTRAGAVSTFFGEPRTSLWAGSLDGIGQEARFNEPTRMGTDAAGNVYVLDSLNYTIRKITPAGTVTTLAGTPGVRGNTDGRGADARLRDPTSMAVAGDGTVYLFDTKDDASAPYLRKITPDGVVTTVEVPEDPVIAGLGAPVHAPRYNGLGADRQGNYYLSSIWSFKRVCADAPARDTCGARARATIRKISPAGVVTILTTFENIYAGQPELQSKFTFGLMTADAGGNVYILDRGNANVVKISPDGKSLPLIPSNSVCRNGTAPETCLSSPTGIAADAAGRVYVVTRESSLVLMFTPEGVGKLIAGKYNYSSMEYELTFGALPGSLAPIGGITAAPDGTVYVSVHSGVVKIVHN